MNNLCEEILSEDIKNISPFRMGNDGLYWERDLPNDKRSTPNGFIATIDYNAPREYEEVWKFYTIIDDETGRITSERRKNKFYKGMSKDEIEKSIEEQKRTYPKRLEEYKQKKEEKGYQKQCEHLKITFYMFYFRDLDVETQEAINNNVSSIFEDSISWKEKYEHLQTYLQTYLDSKHVNVCKESGKES